MRFKITSSNALFFLAVSALLWSMGGVFFRSTPLPALAIAGGRSFFAALTLAILFKHIPRPSWQMLPAALSFLCVGVSLIICTKETSAATAIFLQYTAPLYIPLLGYFILRTPVKAADWIALICIIFGMGLLCFDHLQLGSWMGLSLGLCSGIAFALFIVLAKKLPLNERMSAVFWGNVLTAFLSVPFFIGQHLTVSTGLLLGVAGIIQLGLPYWIYVKAIGFVSPLNAVFIPTLEPLFNPVWVFFILGEPVSTLSILGGLFVLITVSVHSYVGLKSSLRAS
jgi:drug/metabolite transporter (DMT)-like permease